MNIPAHMGISNFLRKDREEGVLFFDPLGEREVGRLWSMRHIGILFVGMKDQLVHVIERHSETGMHLAGLLKALFDQLGVNQFADERSSYHFDLRGGDQLLYFTSDLSGGVGIDIGFPKEGVDDSLTVPIFHGVIRGTDKKN